MRWALDGQTFMLQNREPFIMQRTGGALFPDPSMGFSRIAGSPENDCRKNRRFFSRYSPDTMQTGNCFWNRIGLFYINANGSGRYCLLFLKLWWQAGAFKSGMGGRHFGTCSDFIMKRRMWSGEFKKNKKMYGFAASDNAGEHFCHTDKCKCSSQDQ